METFNVLVVVTHDDASFVQKGKSTYVENVPVGCYADMLVHRIYQNEFCKFWIGHIGRDVAMSTDETFADSEQLLSGGKRVQPPAAPDAAGGAGSNSNAFITVYMKLLGPREPASAAPAASTVFEAPITEARMRALLREEAAPEVISISKASDKRNRRIAVLLEAAGIVGSQGQPAPVVPPTFMPPVELFSWVGGEEARSPAATLQLARYLTSAGVPITDAGVGGPGFKLVDVRREDILTTQLGRVVLKGRPDSIVIPAEQIEEMAAQQARVVFYYKDPCTFEEISAQAQGELLTASSLSHHDVLVVFTDLNTVGHVLRAEDDKLLVWRDLTVLQMLYVVASFLKDECAPVIIGKHGDVRVPGDENRKRRRFSLVERAHALVPKPTELLEQLEVFNTGHWEDYLEGRELLFNAIANNSNTL